MKSAIIRGDKLKSPPWRWD